MPDAGLMPMELLGDESAIPESATPSIAAAAAPPLPARFNSPAASSSLRLTASRTVSEPRVCSRIFTCCGVHGVLSASVRMSCARRDQQLKRRQSTAATDTRLVCSHECVLTDEQRLEHMTAQSAQYIA